MSELEKVSLIPIMTSNISPVGVASASGVYSESQAAWKAFDGVIGSYWRQLDNTGLYPQWIQYEFNEFMTVGSYEITLGNDLLYKPKSWVFEGSSNMSDWTILDTQTNILWNSIHEVRLFSLDNKLAFKTYRLRITDGDSHVRISQISMYEVDFVKKLTLKNPTTNQHYSLSDKTLITLPDASDDTIIEHGIEAGKEIRLDEDFDKIKTVNIDGTFTEETVPPFSVYDYISEIPELIIYNESTDQLTVSTTVEPFSVYDYISENPQAVVYTESTDDITISTTTEPYDLYDEFGDELEVLYYTDDEAVTEADLILEANWSPIDELEGDFEVVTWTDEEASSERILQVEGEHVPIFTYLINPLDVNNSIDNLIVEEGTTSKDTKYLLSSDNQVWYKWIGNDFAIVNRNEVHTVGMTLSELGNIDYSRWTYPNLNIGVYLTNNSLVTKLALLQELPTKSSEVSDLHLYILNTTAKIDIELQGNTIIGNLTDDDSSKVQYRVVLNGGYYFPTNGNFTALSDSPTNINLTLRSQDIKISQWNDLKVEFKDSFGTVDSWEVQFMGQYNGLLFRTVDGEYYSSDIGEVLRYLDFGIIIAGQTTVEQEVVLKNQYGYNVKDVGLTVVESNLPSGVRVEFSNDGVENWQNRLPLASTMSSDEEVKFRVRMRTQLDSEPRSNGTFDIYVNALKDD